GQGHAAAGGLVHTDHARVVGHRQSGIVAHVAVELIGDPAWGGEVRGGDQAAQLGGDLLGPLRARQRLGGVGLQGVLPGGACVGAVVAGAVDAHGAGAAAAVRRPWWSMIRRSSSVTSPITAISTSQRAAIASNSASFSGRTMAIMRSWDSLIRISPAFSEGSRSSTFSRSMRIPERPLAASSLVAQE